MSGSNFVDYVKIYARSGKGGAGSVHFRREKFVEFGGPDGGDGGRGGHVILRGSSQHWTLLHLRYERHLLAESGEPGSQSKSTGADGKDIIVCVPLGVVIRNADTGEQMGEITQDGESFILRKGGRGGQGNWRFRSATNQAPRYAQPGEEMEDGHFIFELKVLADVGLVGFPNAGKSTLLSVVSAAKPEIADYPFTTLVPNLGVVKYRDYRTFIMADIPGIIEGAAEGRGLGTRFLRHIERNSVLLFMIASDAKDIKKEYEILIGELEQHNPDMLNKNKMLAITKSDLLDNELMEQMEKTLPLGIEHIFISSVTGYNIDPLKDMIWRALNP